MIRLLKFLIGLLILVLIFAMLYLSGVLYDTGKKLSIEPYFFQTSLLSNHRVDSPKPLAEISEKTLRDWLIKKYVSEYFSVIPNVTEMTKRSQRNSIIYYMSNNTVFEKWKNNQAMANIQLAESGVLRTVDVWNEISKWGEFWRVDYELTTWARPNNEQSPVKEHGTLFLKFDFTPGDIKKPIETTKKYLDNGNDPAPIFLFKVIEVELSENIK